MLSSLLISASDDADTQQDQAVSYTTGVPAMIGAMMVLTGKWKKAGVYNVEEFDPDPFMEALNKWGLPWKENFDPVLVD